MQDSLEDRIHKAGKYDEFKKAHKKFTRSKKTWNDHQDFYDKLENLGASPEEADEFVNLFMEN